MLKFWKKKRGREASASGTPRQDKLKLVLHVGPHKTGTTSLQWALYKQYAARGPRKLWYPTPLSKPPGHAVAAHASLGFGGTQPLLQDWIDEAQASVCETLIVSAEALCAAYPDKIGMLASQLTLCDVQLVLTLSPICRRSLSLWQGKLKHRFDQPLNAAREEMLQAPGLAADLTQAFADTFASAKVSVIVVDRKAPLDLYRHFASATGIPLEAPKESSQLVANRSLGRIEAEMVRSFNLNLAHLDLDQDKYDAGVKLLRRTLTSDAWQAAVPNLPLMLPEDWLEPLAERCVATVANLRKLAAEGRIETFGDIEALNDSDAFRKATGA